MGLGKICFSSSGLFTHHLLSGKLVSAFKILILWANGNGWNKKNKSTDC
jgi:hypothetical protein